MELKLHPRGKKKIRLSLCSQASKHEPILMTLGMAHRYLRQLGEQGWRARKPAPLKDSRSNMIYLEPCPAGKQYENWLVGHIYLDGGQTCAEHRGRICREGWQLEGSVICEVQRADVWLMTREKPKQ